MILESQDEVITRKPEGEETVNEDDKCVTYIALIGQIHRKIEKIDGVLKFPKILQQLVAVKLVRNIPHHNCAPRLRSIFNFFQLDSIRTLIASRASLGRCSTSI